jgi:hypothetical protein
MPKPGADNELLVLLVDTVILYPYKRLQQDGVPRTLLPRLSHEALPTGLPGIGSYLGWLDHLIFVRVHLPMHASASRIRSIYSRNLYQLCVASVSILLCKQTPTIEVLSADDLLDGQIPF